MSNVFIILLLYVARYVISICIYNDIIIYIYNGPNGPNGPNGLFCIILVLTIVIVESLFIILGLFIV